MPGATLFAVLWAAVVLEAVSGSPAQCEMSYSRPKYLPFSANAGYQALHFQNNGKVVESPAILFVHGSGGSFQQVRSIGARFPARWVGLDMKSELSAISGVILAAQIAANARLLKEKGTVQLALGHSMGGVVASVLLGIKAVPQAVVLGSPIIPIVSSDLFISKLFSLQGKQVIGFHGGIGDEFIDPRIARGFDSQRQVGLPIDHQALVWCKQLLNVVEPLLRGNPVNRPTRLPRLTKSECDRFILSRSTSIACTGELMLMMKSNENPQLCHNNNCKTLTITPLIDPLQQSDAYSGYVQVRVIIGQTIEFESEPTGEGVYFKRSEYVSTDRPLSVTATLSSYTVTLRGGISSNIVFLETRSGVVAAFPMNVSSTEDSVYTFAMSFSGKDTSIRTTVFSDSPEELEVFLDKDYSGTFHELAFRRLANLPQLVFLILMAGFCFPENFHSLSAGFTLLYLIWHHNFEAWVLVLSMPMLAMFFDTLTVGLYQAMRMLPSHKYLDAPQPHLLTRTFVYFLWLSAVEHACVLFADKSSMIVLIAEFSWMIMVLHSLYDAWVYIIKSPSLIASSKLRFLVLGICILIVGNLHRFVTRAIHYHMAFGPESVIPPMYVFRVLENLSFASCLQVFAALPELQNSAGANACLILYALYMFYAFTAQASVVAFKVAGTALILLVKLTPTSEVDKPKTL